MMSQCYNIFFNLFHCIWCTTIHRSKKFWWQFTKNINVCILTFSVVCVKLHNTHQYKISLIGWQHKHRDVVVSQRGDNWLCNFGDPNWLRAGGAPASRHHVESQPRRISHTEILRLRQLWNRRETKKQNKRKVLTQERRMWHFTL